MPLRLPPRVMLLALVMSAGAVTCAVALMGGYLDARSIARVAAQAGPAGKVAYVAAVVVLELLWFPRGWGLLAGGALFGPLQGALLSAAGDLVSAAVCYGLARGAGRTWVQGLLETRPRTARVVDLLARRRGGLTIALLRSCPVAHYTLVSYAAGLAGVTPSAFFVGTTLGLVPAAVAYPLLGHAALSPGSPLFWASVALIAVFLLVTLVVGKRILSGEAQGRTPG